MDTGEGNVAKNTAGDVTAAEGPRDIYSSAVISTWEAPERPETEQMAQNGGSEAAAAEARRKRRKAARQKRRREAAAVREEEEEEEVKLLCL